MRPLERSTGRIDVAAISRLPVSFDPLPAGSLRQSTKFFLRTEFGTLNRVQIFSETCLINSPRSLKRERHDPVANASSTLLSAKHTFRTS